MDARGDSVRITISIDKNTKSLLEALKRELRTSRSDVIRKALHFYSENRHILREEDRVRSYLEMLPGGEHIILDIDHWQLFLNFVEASKEKKDFWERHKRVAKSHGEEFRDIPIERILERLELCNFFTLRKVSEKEFVLIMNFKPAKKFMRIFLEEVFNVLGYRAEIKDDLAKLRVKVLPKR